MQSLPIQSSSSVDGSLITSERVPSRSGGRSVGHSYPRLPIFKAKWAEELHCQTGVYVRRWYIETRWGSIRLHHWLHSDDNRAFHDHPFNFITFVLWGGYTDKGPDKDEIMNAPKISYRPANHMHTVQVNPGGCWTLLLTGPQIRKWGFWNGKKWKKSNKYFLEHGMRVCD
jgi:hypothetical protein